MQCRAAFIVQGLEDMAFLRCDGEGGIDYTHLFSASTPFDSAEQAFEAVEDHCGGRGAVVRIWVPEK